ncbi:MAG: amidohydrolase [Bacillota bacterium]|jgi:predicted amidohydrolase YtcJ|nr:amidohydrolase [Bacillota bacterium]NLV69996.1 amidohydrolase [Clostridiales bacterium]HPF18727.1 amidohydrolase [Bacillota bacterium]
MIQWITNANIATMDARNARASSAVVNGKYFAYVGDEEGAKAYLDNQKDRDIRIIDLQGKLLIPGFNDSHMHYLHYVKTKIHVDLVGTSSLTELLERMKQSLESYDPDSGLWFVGEGWNQDYFADEKRFPTREDLDQITTEYPVMIQRACGHIGCLNSKALELFDMETKEAVEYRKYAEVGENGQLTGVIKENLFDYFKSKMPAPSVETLVEMMIEYQKDLFEAGITSVQSDEYNYVPEGLFFTLQELLRIASEERRFKLRLSSQALYFKPDALQYAFSKGYDHTFGNHTLHISATKLLSDGSLGARTALMRQPYADDPSTKGLAMFTQEELDEMVAISHRNNTPAVIHAIGDGAIQMCLDAIERAQKAMPYLKPRHGIVHCQVTDAALIRRFKELDVVAYIQPVFIDYDMNIIYDRVGKELAESSYAWKEYKDLGIHHPFGTDCPVESFDPFLGIYCAVTRRGLHSGLTYLPEQAMSVEEAIYAYTAEGAYASGHEYIKGKIKEGMLADFAVLDRDLFRIPAEEILETKVELTYVDGECVFARKEF